MSSVRYVNAVRVQARFLRIMAVGTAAMRVEKQAPASMYAKHAEGTRALVSSICAPIVGSGFQDTTTMCFVHHDAMNK
jgi:hypothetical protein